MASGRCVGQRMAIHFFVNFDIFKRLFLAYFLSQFTPNLEIL